MKKFITLLFLLTIGSLSTFAQSEIGAISYGVKLGGASSWVSGGDSPTDESETSTQNGGWTNEVRVKNYLTITGGVYLNYRLSEKMSFRTELSYLTKGYKVNEVYIENKNGKYITDINLPLRYLELPLLFMYDFKVINEKYTPYFIGGLTTNYIISPLSIKQTRVTYDINGVLKSTKTEEKEVLPLSEANRIEIGIAIGAGVKISNRLGVEFRYSKGLSPLASGAGFYNDSINLCLSYSLKKK